MVPSKEIRKIWDEMKALKALRDGMKYKKSEEVRDILENKYQNIEILFGHESTLLKAVIYYWDKKNEHQTKIHRSKKRTVIRS